MASLEERVRRWSAAIREIEVVEPWLTESGWDEHYWDDVARLVVNDPRSDDEAGARAALEDALRQTFRDVPLAPNSGFFRDRLEERLDRIVAIATDRYRVLERSRDVGRRSPRH